MHHHCHDCKHEDIKFCPQCQKPYCVDCGREWTDPCMRNHSDWTYIHPWTYTTCGTSDGDLTTTSAYVADCAHGG